MHGLITLRCSYIPRRALTVWCDLYLTLASEIQESSRRQISDIFPENYGLTFHENCFLMRHFCMRCQTLISREEGWSEEWGGTGQEEGQYSTCLALNERLQHNAKSSRILRGSNLLVFFTKEKKFCDILCFLAHQAPFKKGSILKKRTCSQQTIGILTHQQEMMANREVVKEAYLVIILE